MFSETNSVVISIMLLFQILVPIVQKFYNIPETEIPLTFSWDITYNDGQGGSDIDHDWSHITWGLSTSLDVGTGSFTPVAYYQTSMDDSVNNEDESWISLSYTLNF